MLFAPSPATLDPAPTGRRPRRAYRRTLALAAVPVLLVLAACGGDETTAAAPSPSPSEAGEMGPAAFPVTVTAGNGAVTLPQAPEAIVSLSPTATEMLFAIGAGPQVEAVDDQSTYPERAPRTALSGFQPNAEAVAGYDPDLVVLSNDANGLMDSLEALAIPVLLLPAAATLEESYDQLTLLGTATGHADDAEKVVTEVADRISAAVARVPAEAKGTTVYHELDPTFYSATSDTFIGSVYTLLGLENIADAAADAAGGYPQLSAEYVVKAAPGLIVLADGTCCGQSAQTVAERPAFDTVPAVKNGKVVVVDDDIASRWGPRTADFVEAVAAALAG